MKTRPVRNRIDSHTLVAAIQWIGLTLVFAFLVWTAALVVWQAVHR